MLPWPAVCSSRIIVFPRGRAFSTCVSALEMSESACSVGARQPGAGMQHDAEQAERFGAIHFLAERGDRLRAQRLARRREIDQVAGVRDDGRDAGLLRGIPEGGDLAREAAAARATGWRSW